MIYSKVSTRLTEGNTLPYQETQIFKDVVCEFRKKVIEAKRPLISLSRRADKCKDLIQLFPPKNEDRGGFTTISKFEEVDNRFKVDETLFARNLTGIRIVKMDLARKLQLTMEYSVICWLSIRKLK